jgi:translation initiation factor IF-2
VAELTANPNCPAVGTVVEGKIDRNKGVMATVLIQNGTLRVGDIMVIDTIYGHVRAMFDDKGQPIKEAAPACPAAVLGLSEVPPAGEVFEVFETEREARARVEERLALRQAKASLPVRAKILTLDDIASQIKAGKVKELNIILKADVQGSLEPIMNSLGQLGNEGLRAHILHHGTGAISESDVMLAAASQAIVIGFAVDADNAARRLADQEGVDIRRYDVIYTMVEEIDRGLRGLLEPVYKETVIGKAEVRAVFRIPKQGKVAGCFVIEGSIARDARVRIFRAAEKIFDGYVHALKRFTEDVKEVQNGFECGVSVDNFNDYQEKDILEFYRKERVAAQ